MSESVWRTLLFKLFTQREEMERKLGELHETETLGQRGVRESGSERQCNTEEETREKERQRENKCTRFMQEAMRPPLSGRAPKRKWKWGHFLLKRAHRFHNPPTNAAKQTLGREKHPDRADNATLVQLFDHGLVNKCRIAKYSFCRNFQSLLLKTAGGGSDRRAGKSPPASPSSPAKLLKSQLLITACSRNSINRSLLIRVKISGRKLPQEQLLTSLKDIYVWITSSHEQDRSFSLCWIKTHQRLRQLL